MPPTLRVRVLLLVSRLLFRRSFSELTVEAARARLQLMTRTAKDPTPVGTVVDRTIPGPDGKIGIRIYTPVGAGPFPLLIYFHGGAFVMGDLDTEDETCRVFCKDVICLVISVGYRLAPEHKFPAASDDCVAATRWILEHAGVLNGDTARAAVAGQSAGGQLAAVTALRLRDSGGPPLRGQLLINPITDYHSPATPSSITHAHGYGLTRDDLIWGWAHYLRDPSEATNPHAAPMHARNLNGLPRALVITAEFDPLRDEGGRYAERLREAGTPALVSRYPGMIHGFVHFRRMFPEGHRAMRAAIEWLRQVFAPLVA
jgi:acetyl esterase